MRPSSRDNMPRTGLESPATTLSRGRCGIPPADSANAVNKHSTDGRRGIGNAHNAGIVNSNDLTSGRCMVSGTVMEQAGSGWSPSTAIPFKFVNIDQIPF